MAWPHGWQSHTTSGQLHGLRMKAWFVKAGHSSVSLWLWLWISASFVAGDGGPYEEEAPGDEDGVKSGGEFAGGVALRVEVDEWGDEPGVDPTERAR